MSIIKTTNKFQGNTLERNLQRIEMIKLIKQDINLLTKINKFTYCIIENDLHGLQHIIEDELFFEIVPINIINKYINKLNKFDNINDVFEAVYKIKGENGFRRTMDYLVRRTQ
ncbi:hypothetical protein KGF41_14190 [Clostridioides sp. ZZV14-6150]|uniref:hypothetical protein n=1 Tax=Clostridioides sp. ZZV14-6150 TaxID=2811493 RepID=UPI001D10EEE5|nr:hypothetical protein [Clostridioides sp. ZZV14-6150]